MKAAEVELTKSKADRAQRAKEVTEAIKAANEATEKANKLLSAFVKDYGSFKTTLTDKDVDQLTDFIHDRFKVVSFDNIVSFLEEVNTNVEDSYEDIIADLNISLK